MPVGAASASALITVSRLSRAANRGAAEKAIGSAKA